ncbi:MAG: exodeoxyribonuclease VII large subunit [Agathobacter sp.]|nr:exodeoxyribonuclease VII large subunit [Agathobacter sp.]
MLKNVYSVGQVNQYIKNMFSQDFLLHQISIKGEVSNCKYHSSGHIYFTIKDESGTMNAIMFAGNRAKGLTFRMKEGDKVVVTGSVEVYERDGKYQIYAKEIELDGAGNLYLKFEALKKELEEMGMFAKEYKQPIPKYAMCIGVVTAPTGAAIQDIRNISSRRNPYVQMILYPALVQGENAAASIVNGIHALEKQNVDVIIIGRGGGSIEDLWAFNEEIVARAIFDCSIPIISAVGHETDWTIADFVADMRAPTPSAAAELAVFDYMQVEMQLRECKRRMDISLRRRLELSRERLAHLKTQMIYLSPQSRLNDNRRRLMEVEERLCLYMKQKMQECRHRLSILVEKLDANSPTKKLSGGFAYVQTSERKPLLTISQVSPEENIKIYLADGSVDAKVLEVKKHE